MKTIGYLSICLLLLGRPAPHSPLRGRVRVSNGTVVADDGSLLRMVHGYVHDFVYRYYTDIHWWRAMHDTGHFNAVRVMAFLGHWPHSAQTMDTATLLPRLDTMVRLAAQTGLYVVIDNHSECCGNQDLHTDSLFWQSVAPRYRDNTQVIYELKNEPWQYSGNAAYEETMFRLVRKLAPQTHIIAWTIENLIDVKDPLAFIGKAHGIDYRNASVGFHPYGTYARTDSLLALIRTLKRVYPVVLTEITPDAGAPPLDFIKTMESMGISWGYLGGQGFTDARTHHAYGWTKGQEIDPWWPED
ncbi:MAG TPA: cellulase family glycosylhydrolase [Dinghuibacter sp.]|uniref:glycoside hydrolase family 5 protein n=1 Tax=Dinghuibacter sp. TaxID=2024697 RepID=UPI002B78EA06|nr:cellulase family glycosylhydrolase [Dinghuibacter sp.]HTJ13269.1 cellulase family glycosylhydrolase [Dinghuibacter sp.]